MFIFLKAIALTKTEMISPSQNTDGRYLAAPGKAIAKMNVPKSNTGAPQTIPVHAPFKAYAGRPLLARFITIIEF